MGEYGLLGRKLGHSYSPAIHKLLGSWPYRLYEREPEDMEAFLTQDSWNGLNVTIPYKKAVVPYCQELSPLAGSLGSVNTLVRRPDGTLYGDNTDAWGFAQMARRLPLDYSGKKALVLGSGGASVTVQWVLRSLGAQVTVISRSGRDTYEALDRHRDASVIVNATPVGMYPHNGQASLSLAPFPRLEAVLDLVYNPVRTRLLLEAESLGIPCEGGLPMLVGQAARSSELFTGKPVQAEQLEAIRRKIARATENLILIGMPGSGKTTVGHALAQRLGRKFVDADQEIVARVGIPISQYLSLAGEEAFRTIESQVLAELGAKSSLVITTGGGCVTRPENYPALRQNGCMIWLQRPVSLLPTAGRPLSQREGVAALYAARKELYARFADLTADNSGSLEATLTQILEAISR